MSINCREDLLNRQAKVNEEIKSYTCRVLVCSGTGCIASGAQKIYRRNGSSVYGISMVLP